MFIIIIIIVVVIVQYDDAALPSRQAYEHNM